MAVGDIFVLTALLMALGLVICKFIEHQLRKTYIDDFRKDKYVFITGCDTGFGYKLTKQLDSKGMHVIAACLTDTGSNDLDQSTSDRVTTLVLDVTKHDSIISAYQEVKKIIPHESALWGVVNNAGISLSSGYVEWGRREDYERVLAVNLFGAIDVTLTFLPLLKKSCGRLVNVTSCAGRLAAVPGGYSESKFALEAFSDIVRRERKHFGYQYHVSIIEPGFFTTNITSHDHTSQKIEGAWKRLTEEEKQEFPESLMRRSIQSKSKLVDTFASKELSLVTDAMEHALFARWPKTRYSVGWDAKLLWIPLSYMPSWLSDAIV